jgi:hypothetical protein
VYNLSWQNAKQNEKMKKLILHIGYHKTATTTLPNILNVENKIR